MYNLAAALVSLSLFDGDGTLQEYPVASPQLNITFNLRVCLSIHLSMVYHIHDNVSLVCNVCLNVL